MIKMKLISAALSTAGILGLSLSPLTANASGADLDVIAFSTGNATVVGDATSPCPSADGVCLVGGTGKFSFATATDPLTHTVPICAFASADSDSNGTDAEVGVGCTVTSSGTYHNFVCGTGTADGTATLAESPISAAVPLGTTSSDSYNTTYHIIFVGGLGIIEAGVNALDGPIAPVFAGGPATSITESPADTPLAVEPDFAIGLVQIGASGPDTDGSGCTSSFTVNSVIATNA
ncbi:MAG: hypothetical protein ACYDGR_06695 [Candidatus Dormibacteria bacterium]